MPDSMGLLVADCPRCGSKSMTFDVVAQTWISREFSWRDWYEIFCNCRQCHLPTTFLVVASGMEAKEQIKGGDGLVTYHSGLNKYFTIDRFISVRDIFSTPPPEHLPGAIKNAFIEGATCLSIECFNAAATMFRLCEGLTVVRMEHKDIEMIAHAMGEIVKLKMKERGII